MLRGQARVGARMRWVRRGMAAGVLVGGGIVLAASGAAAEDCLTPPFGRCPGTGQAPKPEQPGSPHRPEPKPEPKPAPKPGPEPAPKPKPKPKPAPKPSPTSTTTTTVASPSTTSAPRPAPTMTGAQAATRLLTLVNQERTERGLPPVEARNDVSSIAMRWSAAMARRGELSHNDGYFSRDTRRKLDARVLGENVARAADVESAHRALMASEHHRANVLDRRFTVVGFGAELANGAWWFTQDFVQPITRGGPGKHRSAATHEHGPPVAVRKVRPVEERDVELAAVAPVPAGPVAAEEPASFRIERSETADGALAGRSRPDRKQGAAVALLGGLMVVAFALRRWAVQQVVHARRAHRQPAVLDERTLPTIEVERPEEGRQHLAVISSWARTLEDRWTTMPANDRRLALQAIERSAEEALADMAMA